LTKRWQGNSFAKVKGGPPRWIQPLIGQRCKAIVAGGRKVPVKSLQTRDFPVDSKVSTAPLQLPEINGST
jgi:hypothetical protein